MAVWTSRAAAVAAPNVEGHWAVITNVPPTPSSAAASGELAPGTARALGAWSGGALGTFQRADFSGITYDAARKQMVFMGGGHQSSTELGYETNVLVLPMRTKAWTPLYPSMTPADIAAATVGSDGLYVRTKQPPARHTYNDLIVLGDWLCLLHGRAGGYKAGDPDFIPCRYNLATNTARWEAVSPPMPAASVCATAPTADGRALVAMFNSGNWGRMGLYDPVPNTFVIVNDSDNTFGAWGSSGAFAYFPPNGKHYFLRGDRKVFEYVFNARNPVASTWSELVYTGPPPEAGYLTLSYDAVNHTLGGCVVNGKYWAVNPVTKIAKLTTLAVEAGSAGMPNTLFSCAGRDPASNHLFALDAGVTWEINPPAF